jgi:hypothetical protein
MAEATVREDTRFVTVKESVKADGKGRVTLGEEFAGKSFEVARSKDGELLLVPVVTTRERDTWLYRRPAAMAMLQQGIEDVGAGRVTEPADFSKYADLEIEGE